MCASPLAFASAPTLAPAPAVPERVAEPPRVGEAGLLSPLVFSKLSISGTPRLEPWPYLFCTYRSAARGAKCRVCRCATTRPREEKRRRASRGFCSRTLIIDRWRCSPLLRGRCAAPAPCCLGVCPFVLFCCPPLRLPFCSASPASPAAAAAAAAAASSGSKRFEELGWAATVPPRLMAG